MLLDKNKILDDLLSELCYRTLDELIQIADNPGFEDNSRCNNWRNYVVNITQNTNIELRTVTKRWLNKPLEERIVQMVLAMREAIQEEWD